MQKITISEGLIDELNDVVCSKALNRHIDDALEDRLFSLKESLGIGSTQQQMKIKKDQEMIRYIQLQN